MEDEDDWPITEDWSILKAFAVFELSSKQEEAVECILRGENVMLHGPGGTGKSRVISRITKYLSRVGKQFLLMAPTGRAAIQIGGRTIHSCIKTGMCSLYLTQGLSSMENFTVQQFREDYLEREMVRLATKKRKQPYETLKKGSLSYTQVKTIKALEYIIVDEISMVSVDLFEKMNAFFQVLRQSSRPFGGLKVVFSGDFFQLPPVASGVSKMVFETKLFQDTIAKRISFDTIQRQKGDPEFANLLLRARSGTMTEEDHAILKSRLNVDVSHDKIEPTLLQSRNLDVEKRNQSELDKLPGPSQTYKTRGVIEMKQRRKSLTGEYIDKKEDYEVQLEKLMADVESKSIELKIGAQVRLTRNWSVEEGLCNGTRGVVIGFQDGTEAKTSQDFFSNALWPAKVPVVRFETNTGIREMPIPEVPLFRAAERYDPISQTQERTTDVLLQVITMPLKLAWAMTIHNSQGLTLSCVQIKLDRIFEKGQAQTALSRVKSLKGLSLLAYSEDVISCSEKVLFFENHEMSFLKDHYTRKSLEDL